jgi:hypothetical protein
VPIARRLARAKSAGLFPWGNFASSASIATANADKAAERDRLQELPTAGEMPIRGIGDHAPAPGGFAQYDRVGPAGAR